MKKFKGFFSPAENQKLNPESFFEFSSSTRPMPYKTFFEQWIA
jgi:hypothetical protein